MNIIRNSNGTLMVPVQPERRHSEAGEDHSSPTNKSSDCTGAAAAAAATAAAAAAATAANTAPTTRLLHPGEGGYDEALAEWDLEQNPDRDPVVSTASGRQEAMALLHAVAISEDHEVATAIEDLEDPEASGEALRHVLVGGVHSVEDFAAEIAVAEGGDLLTAHQTTKIIGEVLTVLD